MGNPESHNSDNSYDWKNGGLETREIKEMLGKKFDEYINELTDKDANAFTTYPLCTAARSVIRDILEKIRSSEEIPGRYAEVYRITEYENKLRELEDNLRSNSKNIEKEKSIDDLANLIDDAENKTLDEFRAELSRQIGYFIPNTLYQSDEYGNLISNVDNGEKLIDNPDLKKRFRLNADVDPYGRVYFLEGSEKIGEKDATLGDLYFFTKYTVETEYVTEGSNIPLYAREETDEETGEETDEETGKTKQYLYPYTTRRTSERYKSETDIDTREYSYMIDYSGCSEEIKLEAVTQLNQLLKMESESESQKEHPLKEVVVTPKQEGIDDIGESLRFEIECDNKTSNGNEVTVTLKWNGITINNTSVKDLPVGKGLIIQEKRGYELGEKDVDNKRKNEFMDKYATLSREDFERDFKGDNFEQENIGNCWMLSFIDSFVNFGDYEKLIRTNVVKNDKGGYDIYLPMGYPPEDNKQGYPYRITSEELNMKQTEQIGKNSEEIKLVTGKIGIKCLVWALARKCNGITSGVPDFTKLQAGIGLNTAELLLGKSFGKISFMDKSFVKGIEKNIGDLLSTDPKRVALAYLKHTSGFTGVTTLWELGGAVLKYLSGKSGSDFLEIFVNYLQMFNKETDMMTVTVLRGDEGMEEHWTQLGGTPHVLSVEKVYKNKKGEWLVKLSNPHDADAKKGNPVYIPPMPFGEFLSRCFEFTFVSKDKEKTKSYENSACKTNKDTKVIMKLLNIGAKNRGDGDFNSRNFNDSETYGKELSKRPLERMNQMSGAKEHNCSINLIRRTADGNFAHYFNPINEIEFKKQEVTAADLVGNLLSKIPDSEAYFKNGVGIDTTKHGKQHVTVIVKVLSGYSNGEPTHIEKEISFEANVTDEKIDLKGEFIDRKGFAPNVNLPTQIILQKELTVYDLTGDLRKTIPRNAQIYFKNGVGIDRQNTNPQPITVVAEHGGKVEEFNFIVRVDRDNNKIKIDRLENEGVGNYYLVSSYGENCCYKCINSGTPKIEFIIGNNTFHLNQSTFGEEEYVLRFINFINYVRKMRENGDIMNFKYERGKLVINDSYKYSLTRNFGIWDDGEIQTILNILNGIGGNGAIRQNPGYDSSVGLA